ncbi:MAG TPA: hypothetical protein VGO22_05065, partial [Pseudorhizobium sp.]|nr:hypothetical protein [Pseudorhizobium sp.]
IFGLGSIYMPVFDDGRQISCVATEVFVDDAVLEHGPDGVRAQIDVGVVDVDGKVAKGRLRRGRNPVGVTFELLVVSLDDPHVSSRGES